MNWNPTAWLLALGLAATSILPVAQAQAWPERPVKLVVPYPPGGNVDTAARNVAPGLQEAFGQPFIVENRAGAGGMIAAEFVAGSEPDGYTLFFTANGPLLYSPLIFGRSSYQWDKDFVPVGSISFTPLVLQVHPSVPAKTLDELFELARKKPRSITMASPGAGTSNHLLSELLQSRADVSWLTVHYKGNAPATTDLLAGHVQFNFDQVSVALPYIQEGRLRPLVVTSARRVPSLPEVPTLTETGIDLEAETFTGIMAPTGTPNEIVTRLNATLAKVLADPAVVERFRTIGAEARAMTPEAFGAHLRKEYERWTPVIRKANITAK